MSELIKGFNVDNYNEQMTGEPSYLSYNSNNTIVFEKLLFEGFDWGGNDWTAYSMKPESIEIIRGRINGKIEDQYRFRELGDIPGRFKHYMKRTITQAVTKQGPVYEKLIDGLDIYAVGNESAEEALIHSEFPQAKLNSEKNDYASSSDERIFSKTYEGNQLRSLILFIEEFEEPDAWVVEQCEKNFSMLGNFTY